MTLARLHILTTLLTNFDILKQSVIQDKMSLRTRQNKPIYEECLIEGYKVLACMNFLTRLYEC